MMRSEKMKIALVCLDDFTDLDLFLPWDVLNRVRFVGGLDDWDVRIVERRIRICLWQDFVFLRMEGSKRRIHPMPFFFPVEKQELRQCREYKHGCRMLGRSA